MSMRIPGTLVPTLALAALLVACESATDPFGHPEVPAVLNEPFTLAPGQTAVLAEEGLSVTFVRVLDDTRCPVDQYCVVAGDATMSVRAAQVGTVPRTLTLTLWDDPLAVDYEGFSIDVQQLMPDRVSNRTIRPEDYRVRLLVTRP